MKCLNCEATVMLTNGPDSENDFYVHTSSPCCNNPQPSTELGCTANVLGIQQRIKSVKVSIEADSEEPNSIFTAEIDPVSLTFSYDQQSMLGVKIGIHGNMIATATHD